MNALKSLQFFQKHLKSASANLLDFCLLMLLVAVSYYFDYFYFRYGLAHFSFISMILLHVDFAYGCCRSIGISAANGQFTTLFFFIIVGFFGPKVLLLTKI